MKELTQNNDGILRESELLKLLELPNEVSTQEIRKAYRRLSKKHHPDVGGDPKMFAKITEAYNILIDDKTREYFNLTGNKVFLDPKKIEQDAINTVQALYTQILKQYQYDVLQVNIVELSKKQIQQQMINIETQKDSTNKTLEKLNKAADLATSDDKQNILLQAIEFGKNEQKKILLESEKALAILEHSLILVNDQNFKFELVFQPSGGQFTVTLNNNMW